MHEGCRELCRGQIHEPLGKQEDNRRKRRKYRVDESEALLVAFTLRAIHLRTRQHAYKHHYEKLRTEGETNYTARVRPCLINTPAIVAPSVAIFALKHAVHGDTSKVAE